MTRQPQFLCVFGLLMASVVWVGCGSGTSCESATDCFSDQVCTQGECRQQTDASNNATIKQTVCRVDPLLVGQCDDPLEPKENDSVGSATVIKEQGGCKDDGKDDAFIGQSDVLDGQLCFDEPGDWYSVYLYQCQGLSYVVEFILTPKLTCEDHRLELNGFFGEKITCEHPDVTCTRDEDGRLVARMVVAASNKFATTGFRLNVGVVGAEDRYTQMPYTLSYEVRK